MSFSIFGHPNDDKIVYPFWSYCFPIDKLQSSLLQSSKIDAFIIPREDTGVFGFRIPVNNSLFASDQIFTVSDDHIVRLESSATNILEGKCADTKEVSKLGLLKIKERVMTAPIIFNGKTNDLEFKWTPAELIKVPDICNKNSYDSFNNGRAFINHIPGLEKKFIIENFYTGRHFGEIVYTQSKLFEVTKNENCRLLNEFKSSKSSQTYYDRIIGLLEVKKGTVKERYLFLYVISTKNKNHFEIIPVDESEELLLKNQKNAKSIPDLHYALIDDSGISLKEALYNGSDHNGNAVPKINLNVLTSNTCIDKQSPVLNSDILKKAKINAFVLQPDIIASKSGFFVPDLGDEKMNLSAPFHAIGDTKIIELTKDKKRKMMLSQFLNFKGIYDVTPFINTNWTEIKAPVLLSGELKDVKLSWFPAKITLAPIGPCKKLSIKMEPRPSVYTINYKNFNGVFFRGILRGSDKEHKKIIAYSKDVDSCNEIVNIDGLKYNDPSFSFNTILGLLEIKQQQSMELYIVANSVNEIGYTFIQVKLDKNNRLFPYKSGSKPNILDFSCRG